MLSITEQAREQLMELLNDSQEALVRIFIKGVGWGGPQYGLTLEESKNDDDEIREAEGIEFIMDPKTAELIKNAEIDYRSGLLRKGFVINTNGSSCSC